MFDRQSFIGAVVFTLLLVLTCSLFSQDFWGTEKDPFEDFKNEKRKAKILEAFILSLIAGSIGAAMGFFAMKVQRKRLKAIIALNDVSKLPKSIFKKYQKKGIDESEIVEAWRYDIDNSKNYNPKFLALLVGLLFMAAVFLNLI